MTEKMQLYYNACKAYLTNLSIVDLRSYGRSIGVARPTERKKEDLIECIIGICTGELVAIPVSSRGAPVKNDRVDERITQKMEALKAEFFSNSVMTELPERDLVKEMAEARENRPVIRMADPAEEKEGFVSKIVTRGQVDCIDGQYCVLPLDCNEQEARVLLPVEIVKAKDLREGDIVSCYTREHPTTGVITVDSVITVNDLWTETPPDRPHFEEGIVLPPAQLLHFYNEKYDYSTLKFVEWLMPLVKGQRGCLSSSPKAGKSCLLLELAKAFAEINPETKSYVLLIDQSPEAVGVFRRAIGQERLFYTTYEDAPERQVFMANFLLKRAKRMVESGKDVVLFIDSLTALAHAYNDTESSTGGKTLSCGLEVKTVRYIKKYFGAARRLENGGSLTLLGTVGRETGNPFDDVICAELFAQANYEIRLNNRLAMHRLYPAIDFDKTLVRGITTYQNEQAEDFQFFLYNEVLPKLGEETILQLLAKAKTYEQFVELIENAYSDYKE